MKRRKSRKIAGILVLILGVIALTTALITRGEETEHIFTVVLDPGHGGEDGGAVAADGTVEKNLNLSLSLRLKEMLERDGIRVIMTRTEDSDTDGAVGFHKKQDLQNRVKTAQESDACLYVSIHINASTSPKDQGFQIWYGSGNPTGREAAEHLTKAVEEKGICTRIRAIKQVPDTLYIFRTVSIPSLLVECGFLSNAADLYRLKREDFQEALCHALCEGILGYLSGISSDIMESETRNPSAVKENRFSVSTPKPLEHNILTKGILQSSISLRSMPSTQRSPKNTASLRASSLSTTSSTTGETFPFWRQNKGVSAGIRYRTPS